MVFIDEFYVPLEFLKIKTADCELAIMWQNLHGIILLKLSDLINIFIITLFEISLQFFLVNSKYSYMRLKQLTT